MSFYRIDTHPLLKDQLCLIATRNIYPEELLFDLSELPIIDSNNKFAITKIAGKEYYDTRGFDVRLINHSCEPNTFVNVVTGKVTCIKSIKVGEMLTFDYLVTEPSMTDPFLCICNSKNCKKYINP